MLKVGRCYGKGKNIKYERWKESMGGQVKIVKDVQRRHYEDGDS